MWPCKRHRTGDEHRRLARRSTNRHSTSLDACAVSGTGRHRAIVEGAAHRRTLSALTRALTRVRPGTGAPKNSSHRSLSTPLYAWQRSTVHPF